MEGLRGVEKTRRDARAVEGAGEFLGDVGRFAHAAENQFVPRRHGGFHRADGGDELLPEGVRRRGEGLGLKADAGAGAVENRCGVECHLELSRWGRMRNLGSTRHRSIPFPLR